MAGRWGFIILCGLAVWIGPGIVESSRLSAQKERIRAEFKDAERIATELRDEARNIRRIKEKDEIAKLGGAVAREVEAIRGLKFRRPVDFELIPREELPRVVRELLRQQYSPGEIRDYGLVLAFAGMLPSQVDLETVLVELLGEQVAAFYNQFNSRMFLFEGTNLKLLQNRIILAHELVHAIQDQHFDLKSFPLTIKDNDDRAMAAQALIEGDATVVMGEYSSRNMTAEGFGQYLGSLVTTPVRNLARAPLYLRESLLFPYLAGAEYVRYLHESGGFERVNQAYTERPASTAMIYSPWMHHEQNPPGDWLPVKAGGDLQIYENTLGAFGLRVWFRQWGAGNAGIEIAQTWRADRMRAILNEESVQALFWTIVLEDASSAADCFSASANLLRKRFSPTQEDGGAEFLRFEKPMFVELRLSGSRVELLQARDEDSLRSLDIPWSGESESESHEK